MIQCNLLSVSLSMLLSVPCYSPFAEFLYQVKCFFTWVGEMSVHTPIFDSKTPYFVIFIVS